MPEETYTPCLAEYYRVSPNVRVYEFKLRKGEKFHNGDTQTDSLFPYSSSYLLLFLPRVHSILPFRSLTHFFLFLSHGLVVSPKKFFVSPRNRSKHLYLADEI